MSNDLSSVVSACEGLNSLDAHVMCVERLDVNYRCEREGPARQSTRRLCVKEINEDRRRTRKGIGDEEQTITYAYRYSSNRRNKNRIQKQLAGMIRTAER